MNPKQLPEAFMEDVTTRRGRRYAFPTLDAQKTALVVVDMQNFFVAPNGIPASIEIMPTINQLAEATRAAGGQVVWIVTEFRDWPGFIGDVLGPKYAADAASSLIEGNAGYDIHPELKQEASDWTVVKKRYSSFLPGASDLAQRLSAAKIDTVLITGTMTNICCETSARDAMMMNFRTIMISDANATVSDALHLASLMSFHAGFGDVRPSEEVLELLNP